MSTTHPLPSKAQTRYELRPVRWYGDDAFMVRRPDTPGAFVDDVALVRSSVRNNSGTQQARVLHSAARMMGKRATVVW